MPYQTSSLLDEDLFSYEPDPAGLDQPPVASTKPEASLELAISVLRHTHEAIGHVINLLEAGHAPDAARSMLDLMMEKQQAAEQVDELNGGRVIEGVFNGLSMIGPDGREYHVPTNYASKSRLVEGDMLKLSLKPDGRHLYKQIAPVPRRRVVGCLAFDTSSGDHVLVCSGVSYKLLSASVSYFKGQPGDEVIAFVPKSSKSLWAAVEAIVKK